MTLSPHWQEPVLLGLRPPEVTGFRVVDEILARRGFASTEAARAWLNPDLDELAEQAVVPGLDQVADRILRAIEAGERIVIFGDYDADGVTSTAILFSALCWASPNPAGMTWKLPTRSAGYGLRESQVAAIIEGGPGLLITVDCGSNDVESIAAVRAAGMDVVVIDHHQISATLPDDVPHANPQRDPDAGATEMTAAGLSWLVVRELTKRGVQVGRNGEGAARYLDLATIGTVGDVASLTGINRGLVRAGIEYLRTSRRPGLRALARLGKFDLSSLTAEDIPFCISPRLNAPGRLGDPEVALNILLASNWDLAQEAANELMAMDRKRKEATELILAEALESVERSGGGDPVIVVSGDTWHNGLLGPVATKLAERFGRPAIVLGGEGELLAGSGRSIGGWDIAAAFRQVSEYLEHHGGHAGAAGLTVARDQLEGFRIAISGLVESAGVVAEDLDQITFEADLGDDEVTFGLVKAIEEMGPFGRGNPRPILRWRDVLVTHVRMVGKDNATAQVQLRRRSTDLQAVMFSRTSGSTELRVGQSLDVFLTLGIDTWNGRQRVKGRLLDAQLST